MEPFERPCACRACGRAYVVRGRSPNPGNETQVTAEFACACGATVSAYVPGSVNPERVEVESCAD